MRILSVVGSGTQSAQAAPLSRALRERGVIQVIFETGPQLEPELTAGEETGRLLPAIEAALVEERPDAVVVFGDTNSTLAGALAAAKLLVPVAHVEAGLRSFDRSSTEELNRVLVDRLSTLLLCPTGDAVRNLAAEGITEGVHVVGDLMDDGKAAENIADLLCTMSLDE